MSNLPVLVGEKKPGLVERALTRVAGWLGFAKVTAIPPGKPNDGMVNYYPAGTELDRPWNELHDSLTDTREAWRKNPMVRRMVSQTTAFIVGPGVSLSSENKTFNKFISDFWSHPQNNMDIRVPALSDDLSRSGELFIVLFTNELDGMSYVRVIPNDLIVEIDFDPNDYEKELRYREYTPVGSPEKWWISPNHPTANDRDAQGNLQPWVLHYAINRPAGMVRGESDLSAILPWIKRYEGWLSDRVSLNAAMRSFYFVVYAARGIKNELMAKYKSPPPKGSVIVAEQGAEEWEAITPQLGARDAKEDGKAIRYMIVAGGLGTALADLGESEDEGLSQGANTNEQRRRFLLQRQKYFVFLLSHLVTTAYNRKNGVKAGRKYQPMTIGDVICKPPDISTEDNASMSVAAKDIMTAITALKGQVGDTPEFRKLALRLFVKFIGESMTEKEFNDILAGDPMKDAEKNAEMEAKYAPKPAPGKPAAKKASASSPHRDGVAFEDGEEGVYRNGF